MSSISRGSSQITPPIIHFHEASSFCWHVQPVKLWATASDRMGCSSSLGGTTRLCPLSSRDVSKCREPPAHPVCVKGSEELGGENFHPLHISSVRSESHKYRSCTSRPLLPSFHPNGLLLHVQPGHDDVVLFFEGDVFQGHPKPLYQYLWTAPCEAVEVTPNFTQPTDVRQVQPMRHVAPLPLTVVPPVVRTLRPTHLCCSLLLCRKVPSLQVKLSAVSAPTNHSTVHTKGRL